MRSPAYSAQGFARFYDRLVMHGIEAFGRYYGSYRAKVVDNVDSDNQGKLKVRCLAIGDSEENEHIAYPKFPSAGADYGIKSIPPKGSFVWVEFENGSPDVPVWTGGWYARNEMPEELKGVHKHGWKTPGGNYLVFVDEEGDTPTVTLRHSNGTELVLSPSGINVTHEEGLVFVGKDAEEAAALGDTLKGLLEELIDAIVQLTVNTVGGPSTPPLNSAQFQSIKQKLDTFLSKDVKVK